MTFVGLEQERGVIDTAIRDLGTGRGGLILVVGEAGIGKSALLQLLADRAAAVGCRAVWGRCSEEPGAPLFWPWLQLLREWLQGRPPSSLPPTRGFSVLGCLCSICLVDTEFARKLRFLVSSNSDLPALIDPTFPEQSVHDYNETTRDRHHDADGRRSWNG